ncbi:hypothetical protein B5X24_HaOG209552 [Helicoverpa armigera]|uniref:Uncharacterized protein n=1 Tax=Helicoverpa armigera TaxID=29058 RepID=A0A2W1BI56_HELAM|nr:hypothetical protein B5X24_HaOG209552 [Helicoverpa armigera]
MKLELFHYILGVVNSSSFLLQLVSPKMGHVVYLLIHQSTTIKSPLFIDTLRAGASGPFPVDVGPGPPPGPPLC